MSDAPHAEPIPAADAGAGHDGPIKTPRQLIAAVVAALGVPIVVIVLLVHFVSSAPRTGAGSDGLDAEAVARRIQPVGTVQVAQGGAAAAAKSGEQVYQAQCAACHASGAAGAPKTGDSAAWAPRVKTGLDALLASARKGKGAMPPQAGSLHSDDEIARAVVYLANQGGAKFAEPAAAAPAASAAK